MRPGGAGSFDVPLHTAPEGAGGAHDAPSRARLGATAFRLSPAARAAPARGPRGQSEARLSPVPSRGPRCPTSPPAEAASLASAAHRRARASQTAMVDGLRARLPDRRQAAAHAQRGRRLHARVPGDRGRHVVARRSRRARARPARLGARSPRGVPRRQRARVHLDGARPLGVPARRRAPLHPARQTDAERSRRELQRSVPRRVPRAGALPEAGPGACGDRALARRLQLPAPPQLARVPDTASLRRHRSRPGAACGGGCRRSSSSSSRSAK